MFQLCTCCLENSSENLESIRLHDGSAPVNPQRVSKSTYGPKTESE